MGSQIDKIGFYYGTVNPSAQWVVIDSCQGCSSSEFKVEECVKDTEGHETTIDNSWSLGTETEMSIGFEFKGFSAGASKKVTSNFASEVVQSSKSSFETSTCATITKDCTKTLYQWQMGAHWEGAYGIGRQVGTPHYMCTDEEPCCLPGKATADAPRHCSSGTNMCDGSMSV